MSNPRRKTAAERKLKTSKHAFRQQVMEDLELTYAARVLGFWLADFMDLRRTKDHFVDTGDIVVFCGQRKLAEKTGCDPADASRHIKRLCKRYHLVIVDRDLARFHGRLRPPNEYLILLGDWKERRLQSKSLSAR